MARQISAAEDKGERCPVCSKPSVLMSCWACCETAWVTTCEHALQRAPMRAGRDDGQNMDRTFCLECALALCGRVEERNPIQ